jgi:hypothetical protein
MGGAVRTHRYRITISGGLDESERELFEDFDIQPSARDTVLTGELDQAALHGTLSRIRWLGLELVEVRRLSTTPAEDEDPAPSVPRSARSARRGLPAA